MNSKCNYKVTMPLYRSETKSINVYKHNHGMVTVLLAAITSH